MLSNPVSNVHQRDINIYEYKLLRDMSKNVNDIVTLDVGGRRFRITYSKLVSLENTYFTLLFNDPTLNRPQKDGSYFIDRNPDKFKYILGFLRDKHINIDGMKVHELRDILDEARFYNIAPLIEYLNQEITSGVGNEDKHDSELELLQKKMDRFFESYLEDKKNEKDLEMIVWNEDNEQRRITKRNEDLLDAELRRLDMEKDKEIRRLNGTTTTSPFGASNYIVQLRRIDDKYKNEVLKIYTKFGHNPHAILFAKFWL